MLTPISYKERRERFFKQIEGGVAIVPGATESIRNDDVHFKFRQESSFFYLTGYDEPDSIAVFRNVDGRHEYILFVRPRDQLKEIWNGYRAGVEGAVQKFGADRAYPIEEFSRHGRDIFDGAEFIYYTLQRPTDRLVLGMVEEHRKGLARSARGFLPIRDTNEILAEMRIRKDESEIERLRKAGEITAKAHSEAMARCRPGLYEYQIEALLEYVFRESGAGRIGYNTIVAGGKNSTILHYIDNNRRLEEGDLLLIDAGAEFDYYTADITRTFPVNGKFSPAQQEIYDAVLEVQQQCIGMVRPGVTLAAVHGFAVEALTDAMIKLKLLSGTREHLIKTMAFKRFYPHGTGHLLGMDVHDIGVTNVNNEPRKLEPGMVFTVEPGLYVQPDDNTVPEKYRGIGVRIEDDVVITATGHEVLTKDVVKSTKDMEALVGSKPWPTF